MTYEQLYIIHWEMFCHYAGKITYDWEIGKDIVQNAFMRAIKHNYEPSENLLKIMIRRECLTYKLQNQRPSSLHSFFNLESEDKPLAKKETEQIKEMLLTRIHMEVEKLPSKCKRIFELKFYELKTIEEIAELLGITVMTVRSQLGRARTLIKSKLLEHYI